MKFKKHEMFRLSPQAVADYLQAHGWRHQCDVERKGGTIWLYGDEEGNEYEIMLPTNRELGDFAVRMGEAIYTLGEVEERDEREVYSTLAQISALPSEIFEGEIAAEEGLKWNPAEKSKLEPLMVALDENCIDKSRDIFLDCLAEIVRVLARAPALIGNEKSKESAVWRSCERVLLVAGWSVKDNVSRTGFWDAARAGQDEIALWFGENLRKERDTSVPHDRVSPHG